MDKAGGSQSIFPNQAYTEVAQNDPEPGEQQDHRSCATRAFKWIVRHPFLAAASTIGLFGVASGGIYGLSLLGAAAPAAVALSNRNMTTASPITAVPTTAAPTTAAPTKAASTKAASTKAAPDHIYSFTGEPITIKLTKMESADTNRFGFVAGENTQGVPSQLDFNHKLGIGTEFSVNLRGSDGENYQVNLIGKLLSHCLSVQINNPMTCNYRPSDNLDIEFGDNSHLPTSLS